MGQVNELKDFTRGQIDAALMKIGHDVGMGTAEGIRAYLRGDLVVKKVVRVLLQFVTTISVAASKKFVTADHFTINMNDDAVIKISHIGDNFKKWFLDKVEEERDTTTLSSYKITKNCLDKPIIENELGGEDKAETTLSEIYYLLKLQPQGETGTLLTDGYWNIFYVKDNSGELQAVGVYWDTAYLGWEVGAREITSPGWGSGVQVFSRNSVLESSETKQS